MVAVSMAEHLPGTPVHLRSFQQASLSVRPHPTPTTKGSQEAWSPRFPQTWASLTSLPRPGSSSVAKSRRGWEEAGKKKQTF